MLGKGNQVTAMVEPPNIRGTDSNCRAAVRNFLNMLVSIGSFQGQLNEQLQRLMALAGSG